ncbi:TetR family transcriptional regulator [Kutzneria viridogrisea]|uniref:AcrR family transcriptional regulator n=1 Tax=Kutzneria viridogrisea TaxID=47990 RepID=A0ABR6BYA6_9PSEU|nr:AcrR family transcriptional regulator [Kutzneria viridogrisea]
MAAADTRDRLIAGALETVRELGVTGVSARTVATRAGVNQALVFYHFDSVDNLLAQACLAESTARVAVYRERFATTGSLRELLAVGRDLHAREQQGGNVVVLAHMLAASHANDTLRAATAQALRMWTAEIEPVLARVLAAGPLKDLFDPAALAHAVAASFIGLELYGDVDPAAGALAMGELDRLGALAEALDGLGPVARKAARAKLGKVLRG